MAGQITQQFLTEIEVHYGDSYVIVEEGYLVDYNSVIDLRKKALSTSMLIDLSKAKVQGADHNLNH